MYCSLSSVITLVIPYYLLDPDTPLPSVFEYANIYWAKVIVSIGAVGALITCLYSTMFPLPRVIYSMSSDGLIFKFFSYLLPKLKTPYLGSIISGLIAGIIIIIISFLTPSKIINFYYNSCFGEYF